MQFKEDFLHFIWKFRLFQNNALRCHTGAEMKVINPGWLNRNAGPDFLQAKLQIDDTLWVGHVELHLKSSDWMSHRHHLDPAYDNVILHVVYENDQQVFRQNGSEIPVFVLKGLFDESLWHNYHALITNANNFPCEKQLSGVESIVTNSFLHRQLVERLESKTATILQQLEVYKGDWERTFNHFLAMSFGFKINAVPFELLASSLDLNILKKYQSSSRQFEALLFGQAGFLGSSFDETYPQDLKSEYQYLSKKHRLLPIDVSVWKFLRMRPQNFPTIRIAQYAALILHHPNLFTKLLETIDFRDYYSLFQDLPIHDYWGKHFHFKKVANNVNVQIGKSSIENILINTICLFLYVYGKYTDQDKYINKAFDLLNFLPAEKNSITEKYKFAGINLDSAFLSQAVLQLNKNYCSQKKCLNCNIGIKILNK